MSSPPMAGLATGLYVPSQTPVEDKLTIITELRKATDPTPDAGVFVAALYASKHPAVVEFICTQLARCDVRELEYFVPQLCNLLIYRKEGSKSLERLLVDLCSRSLHFGLLVHYHFQGAITDAIPDILDDCRDFVTKFYSATVSSSRDTIMTPTVRQYAVFQLEAMKKRLSSQPSSMERRSSVTLGDSLNHRSPPRSPSESTSIDPSSSSSATAAAASSSSSISIAQQTSSSAIPSSQDLVDEIPSIAEAQQFTAHQYQSLKRQFVQQTFAATTDLTTFQPVSDKAASSKMDTFLRPRLTSVDLNRISTAANSVCSALASGDMTAVSEAVVALEGHSKAARIVSAYPATPDSEEIPQSRRNPNPNLPLDILRDSEAEILLKRYRHEFFHAQIEFLHSLGGISNLLKSLNLGTKQLKTAALRVCLQQLNLEFSRGVYHIYNGVCHRIIRIPWKEAFSLNSREKVPYMLFLEVVASEKDESRATTDDLIRSSSSVNAAALSQSRQQSSSTDDPAAEQKVTLSAPLNIIDEWVVVESETQEPKAPSIIDKVFGEPWAKRKERIRRSSPVGNQKGWDLLSMIIKAGDDLRQEQLATQLIKVCHDIFTSAKLPLWLKPYEVRPTSADGGYLETVHDAISLHTLKEELGDDPSLRNYFIKAYGGKTPQFVDAQRNFVESLAAYSLVCYLLQIKDRHNGNILIDREGHLIHIDYGFMLTSSPGSLNFETAPFKLTIEFVEVMGGRNSEMFVYFKHIFGFGFLKLRENARRIISLVEMMLPATKMACFAKGPNTVKELEDRFKLQLPEDQALLYADSLIEQSIGNWRTDSYDTYQRYFSGIAT